MVTQTLNESLGTLPSGKTVALTDDVMTRFLREQYLNSDSEKERRADMRVRLDLYRDRGRLHFEAMVNDVFKNSLVREWRKLFVKYAEFQNVTKRIVREISTVYSETATRTIANGQDRYLELQKLARMDRRMRAVNRLGNLQNNVLVWPDVRNGHPRLRIITQDKLWAIADPNDPTEVVGYVVEMKPRGPIAVSPTGPHYLAMDGQTFFRLDSDWRLIDKGRYPHGVGQLPAVLYSREENEDGILDAHSGKDLVAAHKAVALLNTMMLKHQRSGTRQVVASGDLSTTALNQPMDEEHMLAMGEGVSLQTLDLGADPKTYIDATRAVIKQIAANYGIPESVFDLSYQATSGFEIELKRVGLREVRRDQMLDLRPFERELAEVQSQVLKAAGSEHAFDPAGWSIDFGEVETPQDPSARLNYFEKAEGLDLINRVQMFQSQNPEMDPVECATRVLGNRRDRLSLMVEFQRKNAGAFGPGSTQPAAGGVDDAEDAPATAPDREEMRAAVRRALAS